MNNKLPISVTICAYNEETKISKCIDAVLKNNVQEIIVIDGGSTDKTVEIIRGGYKEVKLIESTKGLSSQRQIGIDNAICPYIAIVDADDILQDDCLAILLKELNEYNIDGIQAKHEKLESNTYWQRAMNDAVEQITSFNGVVEKNVLGRPCLHTATSVKECNFDPFFNGGGNDDTDISFNLKHKGYKLAQGTGITRRSHSDSFHIFQKKLNKYGRDDGRLIYKYPDKKGDLFFHLLIRYPIIYSFNAIRRFKFQYVPFYVMFGLVRFANLIKEYIICLITKPTYKPY